MYIFIQQERTQISTIFIDEIQNILIIKLNTVFSSIGLLMRRAGFLWRGMTFCLIGLQSSGVPYQNQVQMFILNPDL